MSVYDIETLLDDVKGLFTANLNGRITAINTEKNDSISLETIDSNAFYDDMDNETINYDPFFVMDIDTNEGEGTRGHLNKIVTVNAAIIVVDKNEITMKKRMLRYQRCMEEVVSRNFYKLPRAGYVQLSSLPVLTFYREGETKRHKICGLNILCNFAT